MDFKWKTEEEEEWDLVAAEAEPPADRRLGLWLRILLPLLFIVAAAVLFALRAYALRLEAIEEQVEGDVLATHRLLQTASERGDEELFTALRVAGENEPAEGWSTLLDRSAFGLTAEDGAAVKPQVAVGSDFQSAIVTVTVPYAVQGRRGVTETVRLEQSFSYRFQEGQWRLALHDDSFWGGWRTSRGNGLQLVYPARDQALAARLATDLGDEQERIESWLGGCPAALEIQVRLSRNLVSRSTLSPELGRLSLEFPAPTLLGRPGDEPGYQALRTVYARLLAQELMRCVAGPDWTGSEVFEAALQQRLLSDLQLKPWPPASPRIASNNQSAPPVALPAEDLLFLCVGPVTEDSTLYRFDPQGDLWRVEAEQEPWVRMLALPPASTGVLLQKQELQHRERSPYIVYWRDGEERARLEGYELEWLDDSSQRSLLYASDQHEAIVAFDGDALVRCQGPGCKLEPYEQNFPVWSPDSSYALLFDNESEQLYLATGERRLLWPIGRGIAPFWLDEQRFGYVRLEEKALRPARLELLLGNVHTAAREVIPYSEFEALLRRAGEELSPDLFVRQILVHPQQRGTAYLLALALRSFDGDEPRFDAYLFALRSLPGGGRRLTLPLVLSDTPAFSAARFSPDGRWLTFVVPGSGSMTATLYLLNLADQQLQAIPLTPSARDESPQFAWSANGRWLLALAGGVGQLMHPRTGYQTTIVPPIAGCAYAAWVEQME